MRQLINQIISLFIVTLLVCSMITGCTTNTQQTTQTVKYNNIKQVKDGQGAIDIIKELASEKYKGRLPGTQGNQLAAEYIAEQFKQIGLENPKGLENHMQYYTQHTAELTGEPILNVIDKEGKIVKELEYTKSFNVYALSSAVSNIDIKVPLYVVKDESELNVSNTELEGKALLVTADIRSTSEYKKIKDMSNEIGIAAFISEIDLKSETRKYGNMIIVPLSRPTMQVDSAPVIMIDNDSYNEIINIANEKSLLEFKCSVKQTKEMKVANVVGLIPGTDEKLKDEYIIIGAHFDHVGDNMNGTYNPGALDNASGTAAMLEIARAIKQSGNALKKSILFIAFNGEEAGPVGSKYYAENPVYPLEKAVVINLDMVGSSEILPLTVEAAEGQGYKFASDFSKLAEQLNIETKKELDDALSDHVSFANVGVPAILLINKDFRNGCHSPEDNMADVDKDRLKEIINLVLYYVDTTAY